jgi:hypothetical protein
MGARKPVKKLLELIRKAVMVLDNGTVSVPILLYTACLNSHNYDATFSLFYYSLKLAYFITFHHQISLKTGVCLHITSFSPVHLLF